MSEGRILIIDDEADVRESLETLLSLEGFEVEQADSAEPGLRLVERRPLTWCCSMWLCPG